MKPAEIIVFGYAEFPQISLNLPRPEMQECNVEAAYKAIAALDESYLKMCKEISDSDEVQVSNYTDHPHDMPMDLLNEEWTVISIKVIWSYFSYI